MSNVHPRFDGKPYYCARCEATRQDMGACELSVCVLEAPEIAEKRAADHRLRMDVFAALDNALGSGYIAECFCWDALKTAEELANEKGGDFEFIPDASMLMPWIEEWRELNAARKQRAMESEAWTHGDGGM